MSPYKRSIIITGGTHGLGFETAVALARQQHDYLIVIASRSEKGSVEAIKRRSQTHNVEFVALDLIDRDSVRVFAAQWAEQGRPPIHALMLNAGQQYPLEYSFTEDGYEKTFAVGHMGHALLFALLRNHFADHVRIIITASGSHDPAQKLTGMPHPRYVSAEEVARPPPCPHAYIKTRTYGLERYTTSKLATLLWMYALQRRLDKGNAKTGKDWAIFASDPGLMPLTGLFGNAPTPMRFLMGHVLPKVMPVLRATYHHHIKTPSESGSDFAKLAIGTEGKGANGRYFEGTREIKSSNESYEELKQEEMWEWTLEMVPRDDRERELMGLGDLM